MATLPTELLEIIHEAHVASDVVRTVGVGVLKDVEFFGLQHLVDNKINLRIVDDRRGHIVFIFERFK